MKIRGSPMMSNNAPGHGQPRIMDHSNAIVPNFGANNHAAA
ncbi:MAG: hypothetical protein WD970_02895 [Patescibacteria group bacterium]